MTQPLRIDPTQQDDIALAIEGDRMFWDKNVNGSKDAGEPFLAVEGVRDQHTWSRPPSDVYFVFVFVVLSFVIGFVVAQLLEHYRDAPKDAPADRS